MYGTDDVTDVKDFSTCIPKQGNRFAFVPCSGCRKLGSFVALQSAYIDGVASYFINCFHLKAQVFILLLKALRMHPHKGLSYLQLFDVQNLKKKKIKNKHKLLCTPTQCTLSIYSTSKCKHYKEEEDFVWFRSKMFNFKDSSSTYT